MSKLKVRVFVPFQASIPYIIEVKADKIEDVDLEEAMEKVKELDPADWETDPCFYEQVWDNIKHATLTRDDIEECDQEENTGAD